MHNRLLCVFGMVACACSDGVELPVDVIASNVEEVNDGSCETLDCGKNGDLIQGVYFSELYKPPLPFAGSVVSNDLGFRIVHYFASMNHWPGSPSDAQLDVKLGKFASVAPGAWLELESRRDGKHYLVEVYDIEAQPYWTQSVNPLLIEMYWFRYTLPEFCTHIGAETRCTVYHPLCKDKPNGVMAMPAVVFEGEIYKPATFTVEDSAMVAPGTWFNIACAGSIPAKMHMIRRTRAAAMDPSAPVPITPVIQRRAFMNMWAAKYCGVDKSYTQNGHPIRIRDTTNSLRTDLDVGFVDGEEKSIEAVWGPDGALCLNEPRDGHYTRDGVIAECGAHGYVLPKCPSNVRGTWTLIPGAVVLSANPKP